MSATDDTLRTRLYFTGDCDGFPELRDALAQHSELEVIGSSEHVAQATGVLAGGHLDCILHATRSETFPATEIAAIREQTRAPVVVVASGSATAILEEALDADVSDVLLLPQLVDNVVFTIKKASHVKRAVPVISRSQIGRVVTVFSPKGGTGKTVTLQVLADNFSRIGVPVFLADVKGDLSGLAVAGSLTPMNAESQE